VDISNTKRTAVFEADVVYDCSMYRYPDMEDVIESAFELNACVRLTTRKGSA
jgi:hypothetical protein